MPKLPPEDGPPEITIVQEPKKPPPLPAAVQDKISDSRAAVASEILFPENVAAYFEQLKKYRTEGAYRTGAQYGDRLYEQVEQNFVDDPDSSERELLLMQIIDEAGWMQYAIIEFTEEDDTAFRKWSTRAAAIYHALANKRQRLSDQQSSNIVLRLQIIVGEMKMKLSKLRLEWKRGQFFEQGTAQHDTCANALFLGRMMVNQDHQFREADPNAHVLQRQLVGILTSNAEYNAVVMEARRMMAVISGLSYVWDSEYQMRDKDLAEKTLKDEPAYRAMLEQPDRDLAAYINFYQRHRPQPPELRYAYIERIRHMKLLGRYDEALALAMYMIQQIERGRDQLAIARMRNRIGEGQIVLAQNILAAPAGSPEQEEFGRQAKVVDARFDPNPVQEGTHPRLLAFKFLNLGYATCLEAMQVNDYPTARIARASACDGALSLLSTQMTKPAQLIPDTVRTFRTLPLKFDDDTWLFIEAPMLAQLWSIAVKHNIPTDLFREIPSEHFEASHRALALEWKRAQGKPKIPPAYHEQMADKIKTIRMLLWQ